MKTNQSMRRTHVAGRLHTNGAMATLGLAMLCVVGCTGERQSEQDQSAEQLTAAIEQLRNDVRAQLDEFGSHIAELEQAYASANEEMASRWEETRAEMIEYREDLEDDLARLESSTQAEAEQLKSEMAEDIEALSERVERARLDAIEDDQEFLEASRQRLENLEGDLRALDTEASFLEMEARSQAQQTTDELRTVAGQIWSELGTLSDAPADKIEARRDELTVAIGALAASIERELFELKQRVTDA